MEILWANPAQLNLPLTLETIVTRAEAITAGVLMNMHWWRKQAWQFLVLQMHVHHKQLI